MKKTLLALLLALSFIGCKKKEDVNVNDTSLKAVTYTFAPNGASSQIIYKSLQTGKSLSLSNQVALYSVNDQVKIGDKIELMMRTGKENPITRTYEIRVSYNGNIIYSDSNYKTDAAGTRYITLDRVLTKEDLK